jgi:alcohol dehydrogenase YqhD (iron-dependent ADH family)
MKKASILLVAFVLCFSFASAVQALAQEQRDVTTITVKSSEVNNGVVILAAREGKNSFELQCNKNLPGCAVLEPGNYSMVRLPKNYGVYDCANVEMYRTTNDSKLGDRIGQYCLLEGK